MTEDAKQKRQLFLLTLSGAAMLMLLALIIQFNDHGQLIEDQTSTFAGPDFQIRGFDLHEFDLQGHLHYEVTATDVIHYPSNDTTELKAPIFSQTEKGGPVVGSADVGVILSKGDTIRLLGNAILKQPSFGKQQEVIARSDHFTYYPNKRFAETEADVSFTSPGSTMTGTGMTADFAAKELKLQGNVKGTHATN